jgi:phosphoglycerate dehydrogenase-like enzyme
MESNKKYSIANDPQVAVTSVSFSKTAVLRQELERVFPNTVFNEQGRSFSEAELVEVLRNVDAAIIGTEQITDKILTQAPGLKIISKYGVGLDNIDQSSLKKKNITLGWTGGVNKRSVSEMALCFMLGLCRNIFNSGYKLKQSKWEKNGGFQLTGKTIGIIGCGHVGSDVIQLLAPFNCTLLVHDIVDKSDFCREHGASVANLEKVIEQSDVITIHVPLTKLTRHMVDQDFLQRMKQTAFLINTSRGDVVDQDALKNSLTCGSIAGAAIDVFAMEPPSDMELLSLPQLMVTPHIGGNAIEAVESMGRSAISHLVTFFNKHPLV